MKIEVKKDWYDTIYYDIVFQAKDFSTIAKSKMQKYFGANCLEKGIRFSTTDKDIKEIFIVDDVGLFKYDSSKNKVVDCIPLAYPVDFRAIANTDLHAFYGREDVVIFKLDTFEVLDTITNN